MSGATERPTEAPAPAGRLAARPNEAANDLIEAAEEAAKLLARQADRWKQAGDRRLEKLFYDHAGRLRERAARVAIAEPEERPATEERSAQAPAQAPSFEPATIAALAKAIAQHLDSQAAPHPPSAGQAGPVDYLRMSARLLTAQAHIEAVAAQLIAHQAGPEAGLAHQAGRTVAELRTLIAHRRQEAE